MLVNKKFTYVIAALGRSTVITMIVLIQLNGFLRLW